VLVIMVLVIIAIPISGFTLNQIALTNKGRRAAATIEDVRVLKQADATAFTQLLAAIMRKLPMEDFYRGRHRPPQNCAGTMMDQHRASMVSIELGDGRDPGQDRESHSGQLREYPAAGSFWASLTVAEQRALAVAARQQTFDGGVVLWRQSQHGDYVIIIRSGKANISIKDALGERVIATRGLGDIVGERAALRPGSRSATVITASELRAFVIGTAELAAVVAEHPHVLEVLESQIYGRLTEDRLGQSPADETKPSLTAPGTVNSLPPWTGQNCSICITDITAFSDSSRRDGDRISVRTAMYRMLADAFNGSGITWHACYREDRGDGALIIVPPSIPTSAVVDAVVGRLAAALGQHNRQATAATSITLRVAIHVGPVTTDPEGVSGHAINQAARLIEAAPLKSRIAETAPDLGLTTSEFVYDTAISQNYGSAVLARYQKIQFRAKGSRSVAWMYLSGTANK
jgi:CRP-like cAMP-binding protein